MKNRMTQIIVVVAVLFLAAPAFAQLGSEEPETPAELDQQGVEGRLDPAPPSPPVIYPIDQMVPFSSDEMQLVGFTTTLFTGNHGVLNMSIGCQREFPASRMCTLEEINRSVFIPQNPICGNAWAQDLSGAVPQNCNGWRSESSDALGMAINLGGCYGGVVTQTCDSQLAVACCSKQGYTVLR
jgi:hypothetical protein